MRLNCTHPKLGNYTQSEGPMHCHTYLGNHLLVPICLLLGLHKQCFVHHFVEMLVRHFVLFCFRERELRSSGFVIWFLILILAQSTSSQHPPLCLFWHNKNFQITTKTHFIFWLPSVDHHPNHVFSLLCFILLCYPFCCCSAGCSPLWDFKRFHFQELYSLRHVCVILVLCVDMWDTKKEKEDIFM